MQKITNPYVVLILALLGAFLLFSFWSARQAMQHGSRISDTAYYSKGLRYTSTQIEKQAAASQGWQLATKVERSRLLFTLRDIQEHPIDNALGELSLYLSDKKELLHLDIHELGQGEYQVELPPDLHGSHQALIEFTRQGARISRQLLLSL